MSSDSAHDPLAAAGADGTVDDTSGWVEPFVDADEEPWIADFPPWWTDWLIQGKAAKTRDEAHRLLHVMRAIEDGDVEAVRRFLNEGGDPRAKLLDGWGNLLEAAAERCPEPAVVELLIERGADASDPLVFYRLALRPGCEDITERLLDRGADPNLSPNGQTLLAGAAILGNSRLATLLLAHGADINKGSHIYPTNNRKVTRCTPLMLAAWMGRRAIVKQLLEAGADVNRKDSSGSTALDWARRKRGKQAERIQEVLEQAGATAGTAADLGMVAVPDFSARAKSPSFEAVVAELRELVGGKPSRIEVEDEGVVKGSAAVHTSEERAREFVRQYQDSALERGCLVFWSRDVTARGGPCVVALPTTDVYEAIAAVQTAGPNSSVSTGDVIASLKAVEHEQPFRIEGIAEDLVDGHFTTEIQDRNDLAARILKLCPDGRSTAAGERDYADYLARTRRLFLWWD